MQLVDRATELLKIARMSLNGTFKINQEDCNSTKERWLLIARQMKYDDPEGSQKLEQCRISIMILNL